MQKLKSALAALLIAGVSVSMLAFTACNKDEDNGSVQLTPGEQVASEKEWRQAFENLYNVESLTFNGEASNRNGNEYINFKSDCKINYVNGKCLVNYVSDYYVYDFIGSSYSVAYCEVRDTTAWGWYKSESDGEKFEDTDKLGKWSTFEEVKNNILEYVLGSDLVFGSFYVACTSPIYSNNGTDYKCIYDLYSEFTYSDGIYSASLMHVVGYHNHNVEIKVSIQDGNIKGMSIRDASEQVFTVAISDINSTTVTAPAEAIEAINAAESATGK